MAHLYRSNLSLVTGLALISVSCAAVPKQIALNRTSVAHVKSAALKVNAAALKVEFHSLSGVSSAHGWVGLLSVPAALLSMGGEVAGKRSADAALSKAQGEHLVLKDLETHLGNAFLQRVSKAGLFAIAVPPDTGQGELLDRGYDALVRLDLNELRLRHADSDRFRLLVSAWGSMTDLRTGRVLWKQIESLVGNETHTLAELRGDEGHLLWQVVEDGLDRLATRMAADIIYAD